MVLFSESSTPIIFAVSSEPVISLVLAPDRRVLGQASPCCFLLEVVVGRGLASITSRSWYRRAVHEAHLRLQNGNLISRTNSLEPEFYSLKPRGVRLIYHKDFMTQVKNHSALYFPQSCYTPSAQPQA